MMHARSAFNSFCRLARTVCLNLSTRALPHVEPHFSRIHSGLATWRPLALRTGDHWRPLATYGCQ